MQPNQINNGTPVTHHPDYDFIVNPVVQPRISLLKPNTTRDRVLVVAAIVLGLIVISTVVSKVFFGGNPAIPALTSVLQEQQELIHLTATPREQPSLSSQNATFATTVQLTTISAQQELIAYFKANHQKVDQKTLTLRVSPGVDAQLAAASAASTYNAVFKEVMNQQLTTYQKLLKQAFNVTKGTKGRTILNKDYEASKLLVQQLNS